MLYPRRSLCHALPPAAAVLVMWYGVIGVVVVVEVVSRTCKQSLVDFTVEKKRSKKKTCRCRPRSSPLTSFCHALPPPPC